MNNDYILRIAESKSRYHLAKSKMSYEEKFKIVLKLQKLDSEIRNSNPSRGKNTLPHSAWQLPD